MADNVSIDPGTTTPVRTREIGGVQVQVMAPEGGALTDGSGTITTGGTSQQVFAANASRRYLLIQNVSDTDAWVNFGTAAVANQPSLLLRANGGSIVFEGSFVPTGTVNIRGATTGKAYTAKEA